MPLTVEDQAARIAIMGATGSGKSTFINLVSGSALPVSDGLKSCTSIVMESQPFTLDDQSVVLIDTPGFDDSTRSDTDIITTISTHLARTYQQRIKLAGVIYMHRISDVRMGGASRHNFCLFRALCGDESLCNVFIVTTMWSGVNPTVGERRERELVTSDELFKPVIDQGAQFVRHAGTMESARDILRQLIVKEGTTLRIQRELVDEGKQLAGTTAGVTLTRLLAEQAERLEARTNKLYKDIEAASQAQDAKARKELQWELSDIRKKRKHTHDESERLQKVSSTTATADAQLEGVSTTLVSRTEAQDVKLYNDLQFGSRVKEQDQIIDRAMQEMQRMRQEIEQMTQLIDALVTQKAKLMTENHELRERQEHNSKSFFQRFHPRNFTNFRWLD